MAARRRLQLILPAIADRWRRFNLEHGFAAVAGEALAAGWDVELLAAAAPQAALPAGVRVALVGRPAVPVIAGPGSAADSEALRFGHLVWRAVAGNPPAAILAPLAGGVLQPCLVSRALGESLTGTAMLVWGDASTRARVLAGSVEPGLASLVADALERGCLARADAVIVPGRRARDGLRRLGATDGCFIEALLVTPAFAPAPALADAAERWVHLGPGSRAYGADRFLDAAERAAARGQLPAGGICLAGPWRRAAPGLSKRLVGLRALDWSFPFTMLDDLAPDDAVAAVAAVAACGGIAMFSGTVTDDDVLVAQLLEAGHPVALAPDHRLADALAGRTVILDLPGPPGTPPSASSAPTEIGPRWPAILDRAVASVVSRPTIVTGEVSVSLCITHRDRPDLLAAAVASAGVGAGFAPEIVVADAGSDTPAAADRLAALEADGVVVLRLGPVPQAAAYTAAAHAAHGDVLLFLDDDNAFVESGAQRLVQALVGGSFDIVVANLSMIDDPTRDTGPVAERIFIGEPASAGLFFNGFGDTCFAIRRASFLALGGFGEETGAALDWLFLARARAARLRIGVLQQPALAYRRDLAARHTRWRRNDLEGTRARVQAALQDSNDPALVTALALTLACHIE